MRARAAGVTISVDAPELPAIDADPALLRRVLANVLGNALRHTPAGGRVAVVVVGPVEGGGQRLTVTDTGPGIPPEVPEVAVPPGVPEVEVAEALGDAVAASSAAVCACCRDS